MVAEQLSRVPVYMCPSVCGISPKSCTPGGLSETFGKAGLNEIISDLTHGF